MVWPQTRPHRRAGARRGSGAPGNGAGVATIARRSGPRCSRPATRWAAVASIPSRQSCLRRRGAGPAAAAFAAFRAVYTSAASICGARRPVAGAEPVTAGRRVGFRVRGRGVSVCCSRVGRLPWRRHRLGVDCRSPRSCAGLVDPVSWSSARGCSQSGACVTTSPIIGGDPVAPASAVRGPRCAAARQANGAALRASRYRQDRARADAVGGGSAPSMRGAGAMGGGGRSDGRGACRRAGARGGGWGLSALRRAQRLLARRAIPPLRRKEDLFAEASQSSGGGRRAGSKIFVNACSRATRYRRSGRATRSTRSIRRTSGG